MRFQLAAAALLVLWQLAAAASQVALLPPTLELTADTAGSGSLTVAGLRFRGCPRHGLRVLLLPDGSSPTSEDDLAAGQQLDFEQTYDGGAGSWTLRIAGAPAAGRLDVWCSACRSAAAPEQQEGGFAGLLSSQPLPGGHGNAVLVLHLRRVELPAAAGAGTDAGTGGLSTSRRRLAQAGGAKPQAKCDALTVGGKEYTFASCTQPVGYDNLQMTLYSSVVADGAGSQLRMGLVAATGGGWAGFGLPETPGMMMGASSVIVWPSGKGAEVDGFKIPESYAEADINKARGTFKITDAVADQGPKGELRAVFTIPLPKEPANKVASAQVDYIYAIGEMMPGGKPAPGIGSHAVYGPFGGSQMTVKQAKADAADAPSPAPKPDAEADAKKQEEDKDKEGAAAPQLAAEQPAGGSAGACTLQLAAGAAPQAFAGCRRIVLGQTQMHLLWSSAPKAGNPAKTMLTLGLNATGAAGYVALGFPSRPGRMVDANAFLLSASSAAANGAQLEQYYLAGERQSDVQRDERLVVSGTQAAQLAGGDLVATFQLEVDTPTAGSGRRLQAVLQNGDGTMPLIFAAGSMLKDGTPIRHYATAADSPPLLAGDAAAAAAAGGVVQGEGDEGSGSMRAAHGWLAAIGWGVLVPAGVVMARSFKELDRTWFHLHRILQTLGFVMGTVALGLGFALAGGWEAEDSKHAVHRNLGMACTVLGACQFSAVVWRPAKGQRFRVGWELWHHWVGRAAAVVAIANIYYGCIHMVDLGAWPWACYTAVLAVIVGISLAKDASDWLRARNKSPGTPKSARVLLPSPVKSHDVESGTNAAINGTGPTLDGMSQPHGCWKDSPASSEQ